MTRFTADDDLRDAEFDAADLTGARFRFTDLEGAAFSQSYLPRAVMRGVDLTDADIDGQIGRLKVNGVEVLPLIEAELNRRHPGRELARSQVLAEQRESFEAAQRTWSATLDRVAAMPAGTVDEQVDGEWSVAQTLRHLVFAVDGWVRHGIQGREGAFSPIGLPFSEYDDEAAALGVDVTATPSFHEVRAAYADRVAQVRAQYDSLTQEEFEAPGRRLPPWESDARRLPVWRCLGVIVNEAWEHHRFAERDLDELERRRGAQ
ncbi:DinB family protein [Promicromonospora sp. NPDC057138]|uniref:DinB family protein n=1 Tax=Promicromonospora sp. NPDC057138 TaxID=3346031 RepID=UPI003632ACE0